MAVPVTTRGHCPPQADSGDQMNYVNFDKQVNLVNIWM
jgi:hypothetical protein